ncbi:hypothetical protein N9K11_01595 [bacterium]|nr:hypothetical protein [bacterium]
MRNDAKFQESTQLANFSDDVLSYDNVRARAAANATGEFIPPTGAGPGIRVVKSNFLSRYVPTHVPRASSNARRQQLRRARRNKLLTNQKFQYGKIGAKKRLRDQLMTRLRAAIRARPRNRALIRELRGMLTGAIYQLQRVRDPARYITQTHQRRQQSKAAEEAEAAAAAAAVAGAG